MVVSREEVEKTAALARLAMEPQEITALAEELREFIIYLQKLKAIPPEGAREEREGNAGTLAGGPSPLRREQVLALAPASCDGYIQAPGVMEDE